MQGQAEYGTTRFSNGVVAGPGGRREEEGQVSASLDEARARWDRVAERGGARVGGEVRRPRQAEAKRFAKRTEEVESKAKAELEKLERNMAARESGEAPPTSLTLTLAGQRRIA